MAKAAAVQYAQVRPIEHVHPLVRTEKQLARVLKEVEQAPGIVLYTIVKNELIDEIERRCRELKVPCLHVLRADHEGVRVLSRRAADAHRRRPAPARRRLFPAASMRSTSPWPTTTASCRRISTRADIIILGISRTSKTPTSIYLAQRGYKTANLPLVPGIEPPAALTAAAYAPSWSAWSPAPSASPRSAATACSCIGDRNLDDYVDRTQIANEIQYSRRLCARHGWPVIDVTRRSVEETAATIIRLLHDRAGATAAEQQETGDG